MSQFHSASVPLALLASSAALVAEADAPLPDPPELQPAAAASAATPTAPSCIASRRDRERVTAACPTLVVPATSGHFLSSQLLGAAAVAIPATESKTPGFSGVAEVCVIALP
jgi:hypothetical protein